MSGKGRTLGLFEFLEEAELQQYYNGLKNVLQVHNVQQLKYVVDDDLFNIGMSRPEARRIKTLYSKIFPQNYASKLKKLLRPGRGRHEDARHEFLLPEDAEDNNHLKDRRYSTLSNIKVPSQHIIPSDAIQIHKELGSGEFGVVQQGTWTDDDQMRHQVAVKCLSRERMQNNTVEFMKEYDIMASIDHPNAVRLYGVVLDSSDQRIMLITELAPLRSLLECLKEPSLRVTLDVACLAGFAEQICRGMRYLESKRLIHRDLAARNILVFSKSVVKVSDFGLSRALGVGKDYYQTNFNANLKLPIAWCAPECINFLKFTSASDVWSFGVTAWEMFSYGFQPWAAHTGQQILESIDEPNSRRLEQPVHCPREHYNVMLACWRHDPAKRPTFERLCDVLEEARPEQVQAVVPSSAATADRKEFLEFDVGDVVTVLDKQVESPSSSPDGEQLWSGAMAGGRIGLFYPSQTVAYVATMPSQGNHSRWHNEEVYHFQRSSLRGSRGSRRKISREMISGPKGDVQHTAHIGVDGAFFGDVGFAAKGGGNSQQQQSKASTSSSSSLPFASMPSLTRADSDASERAPLITRGKHNSQQQAQQQQQQQQQHQHQQGANKNPRMGYAIGYLRKTGQPPQQQQGEGAGASAASSAAVVPSGPPSSRPHEYHTIVDEELGGPLDLGPSLMDEVFNELETAQDEADGEEGNEDDDESNNNAAGRGDGAAASSSSAGPSKRGMAHSMRDLVSTTLMRSGGGGKGGGHHPKQQATVKPIKASDEKAMEDAIAMANALASKSMHDLDKRHHDFDHYGPAAAPSPNTPNSPSKKFHFWFPGGKQSPKAERRPFSEEAAANSDLSRILTPGVIDTYKALIEGSKEQQESEVSPRSPRSPNSPLRSPDKDKLHCGSPSEKSPPPPPPPTTTTTTTGGASRFSCPPPSSASTSGNPLPLPPKTAKLNLSQPPKRHVRKNPLIIPSGTAANLLRRGGGVGDTTEVDPVYDNGGGTSATMLPPPQPASHHLHSEQPSSSPIPTSNSFRRPSLPPSMSYHGGLQQQQPAAATSTTTRQSLPPPPAAAPPVRHPTSSDGDDFENAIACDMDALDALDSFEQGGGAVAAGDEVTTTFDAAAVQSHPSTSEASPKKSRGKGATSDEVRIMQKVLNAASSSVSPSSCSSDAVSCVTALDATEWNVHRAIKLVKLRALVSASSPSTDSELLAALKTRDWDVAKAASVVARKSQE